MSSSTDFRVGLIGYGPAGAVFHAPLIAAARGLRLNTIVTANPQRRQQALEDHPGVLVETDSAKLFERAGELDLVVVATPNSTHDALASAALEAGLPVVVDKPLTPTAERGRALIEQARRRGLLLSVFQNRRWDNDVLTVSRLLDEGRLGDVHRFESRFQRWVPTPKDTWRDRGAPGEGGGVLYDLGSHLVDQALRLFGPVRSVYAELDERRPGVEVDDDSFLALTHLNGVRSHLWMSKLAAQSGPRFRVLGNRAAYTKHGFDPQEAALRSGRRPGESGWGVESEQQWGRLGDGEHDRAIPTENGCYPAFYEALARALRDGTAPPVDPTEVVTGLEIIEAARKSSAEAAVVTLAPETATPR
ncbi:putative dehydrogenase [Saccharopolyspora lacisalsi]|uniref:Putative dehydrogenase n=1 Tax=Halosaccharopolyspora lacisalsi TaxID=1000566 RepID=A0A839DW73_9PSEU|nr:Gfo/Idh/MocA family oxidoreductase [Halosaccharopolyspora lacisalsi]MBA8825754.1 putative dehydrogenase [Halosaccharopolyspora lacisalsi]